MIIKTIILIFFGLCIWCIIPRTKKENREGKLESITQPIACPRCGSTSITLQKQGFDLMKASRGGSLSGGLDFLPDGINAKKNHRVCTKCGKKF